MIMLAKRLASGNFDSFLKSKKIAIVRLHEDKDAGYGWDRLDEKIKNYFVAEYQSDIALGSLAIVDISLYDLWAKKHLGQFSGKGQGYYLALNGQLIAYHSEEADDSKTTQSIANLMQQGRNGWAAFLAIAAAVEKTAASQQKPNLPEEVAKSIVEFFESALSTAK